MMDYGQARTFAIVYRRHLLTLIDKIERDFHLGKYETATTPGDVSSDPLPDMQNIAVLSNVVDTDQKKE